MAPTPEEVAVAIEALRADASLMRSIGGELAAAANAASNQVLSMFELAGLSDYVGLPATYAELQQQMVMLLKEGERAFDSIADALNTAANAYEDDERNVVRRMNAVN
ncbi:type VII secretion target [Planosporangium mesophilum]|uniref:ESX-1 secretion-associated protein n=1 Tax=Planosporangium mesophilum TaxID=689768 RepID=A0A8J3T9H2_9ACTN|nr:hypothetical protein [Planosporangium mesophilum]NJC81582.1 hypothetical protein [Planosporangium mesophilum]GII20759.1 hypothetical protein Pme01_03560 [Planosporangium mesophilum]